MFEIITPIINLIIFLVITINYAYGLVLKYSIENHQLHSQLLGYLKKLIVIENFFVLFFWFCIKHV